MRPIFVLPSVRDRVAPAPPARRRSRGPLVALLALLLAPPAPAAAQLERGAPAAPATLILTGGKVFTADPARPWAEALAIRGDRIADVGTTAAVRRRAGPGAREIALAGRVVIPGINDAHDHVGEAALGPEFRTGPSPTPNPTAAVVLDSLAARAARQPPGSWLRTQVGLAVLDDTAVTRAALDRVAPSHPVMLHGWWGHGMILNGAALRALGFAEGAADPLGGRLGRDPAGRLDGRLDEYAAWDAMRRLGARQPEPALVAALRAYGEASLRLGVTSVQNMAGYLPPERTVRVFRAAELPLRVRLIRWSIPTATGLGEAEWDGVAAHPAPRVVVDGRKWVLEGTPVERLMVRRTPYAGRPGWYGRPNFPPDTVRAMLAAALRPGAPQLHLHVVGDSTLALVLGAMEALAPDAAWRARRVRLEHGNAVTGPEIARVARLGIVIAQPRGGVPYRAWRAAGIEVAYGSDMLRNPFLAMRSMVTGDDHPEEAVSREEAVRLLTRGGAYAERAEAEKGVLAPGRLADLAVLSQDVFTVPAAALPGTHSVLTVVGGEVAHDALPRPRVPAPPSR